jgi:hypothetical protein
MLAALALFIAGIGGGRRQKARRPAVAVIVYPPLIFLHAGPIQRGG